MTSRERTIHVSPAGYEDEIELEVHFSIDSFGTSDTYWEPGDPASISIEEIFKIEKNAHGIEIETNVTAWAYRTFHSWNVSAARVPDYRPQTAMRKALFGDAVMPYVGPRDRAAYFAATVETIRTSPETVAAYVERIILENVHDYQDEEPDYDYSY